MASRPSEEVPQVMGAQRTTSTSTPATTTAPILEGESNGPQYGATTTRPAGQAANRPDRESSAHGGQPIPNGVDPRRETGHRDEQLGAASRSPYGPREGPTGRGDLVGGARQFELQQIAHGSNGAGMSPGGSSGFVSAGTMSPPVAPSGVESEMDQPQHTQRAVSTSVEYHYAGAEPGQPVVRWVARLTEFLRATTSRTNGFQGRVLEGLGFTTTQGSRLCSNSSVLSKHRRASSDRSGYNLLYRKPQFKEKGNPMP